MEVEQGGRTKAEEVVESRRLLLVIGQQLIGPSVTIWRRRASLASWPIPIWVSWLCSDNTALRRVRVATSLTCPTNTGAPRRVTARITRLPLFA
ncbi:unnamed protein product, partial [Pleuronectes platessa]